MHVRDPGPLKRYTEVHVRIDYYVHVNYVHKQLSLCPQVIGPGFLVGVVVAACVALTLLYAVILLVWILWNKR